MAEDNSGFKVADRRLFTPEGELRDISTTRSADSEPSPIPPSQAPESQAGTSKEVPMTFQALVFSLSTSALLQLGLAPNPASGKPEKDLPAAKQTIDILEILQEKTKGNLTPEEAHLLEDCLYDLKMSYVRLVQGGKL